MKPPMTRGELRVIADTDHVQCGDAAAMANMLLELLGPELELKWDGQGMPPVGSRVEVAAEDFEDEWLTIDVAYVHNGVVAGIVRSENEYLDDQLEKFSAGYNRAKFRPILSEAEKNRDEAISKITDAICGDIPDTGMATAAKYAARAYDAIAAGKIPWVTIE